MSTSFVIYPTDYNAENKQTNKPKQTTLEENQGKDLVGDTGVLEDRRKHVLIHV